MADKDATQTETITDPHQIPCVFISDVAGSGFLNGVINVTLATARFTPSKDNKVAPDLVITSRLRMDLYCAQRLHDALAQILAATAKPSSETSTH